MKNKKLITGLCIIIGSAFIISGCTKKPVPTASIESSVINSNIESNIESTEQISASTVCSSNR